MRIPPSWISAARFTIGVLLVWGGVLAVKAVLNWETQSSYYAKRMSHNAMCSVQDFLGELHGSTPCVVFNDAYTKNRMLDLSQNSTTSSLEWDALVRIMDDSLPSKMNERGFESRLVEVQYVTGPLSGKKGMVYRYTLIPINR